MEIATVGSNVAVSVGYLRNKGFADAGVKSASVVSWRNLKSCSFTQP